MPRLVLTVIGDDRSGLVRALADVVTEHGGNWEESQLAELAGKFAGIVVVSVPEARAEEFATALSTPRWPARGGVAPRGRGGCGRNRRGR